MATGRVTVPNTDPIDMTNGRLKSEWRIFFSDLSNSLNSSLGSADSVGTLQAQLTQEVAERKAADALLLPKDGGTTGSIGFQGASPSPRLAVVGPRGGNHALQTLLIQLARYGLITDSTTGP